MAKQQVEACRAQMIEDVAAALIAMFGDQALAVAEQQAVADNESNADWRRIAARLRLSQ